MSLCAARPVRFFVAPEARRFPPVFCTMALGPLPPKRNRDRALAAFKALLRAGRSFLGVIGVRPTR